MTNLDDLGFLLDAERAELQEWWATLDPEEQQALVARLDDVVLPRKVWKPLPYQIPPGDEFWRGFLMMGGRGIGKLLDLDTPIPTPTGFRPLRTVAAGDELFDEQGRVCRVTAVYDDWPERAWRVEFSDGAVLVAGGEHLWTTWTVADRKAWNRYGQRSGPVPRDWPTWRPVDRWGHPTATGPRIRTTDEIAATAVYGNRGDRNHSIPVTAPLEIDSPWPLPIDPWVFGAWLGDGDSAGGIFTVGAEDVDWLKAALTARGAAWVENQSSRSGARRIAVRGLRAALKRLGVWQNKHVPDAYLWASAQDRLDLLRGLLDTDGCVLGRSGVEFTSTREELATAVVQLARSLGEKPTIHKGVARLYGKDCGLKWRVTWRPVSVVPFSMPRKAERIVFGSAQESRLAHRMIVSVTPVAVRPMRCLTVDSPHGLFLAGEAMIPTHNTATICHLGNEHATGPPCLDGPVPHRMGIIAPTQGDASASIVYGEDGLMSINPALRVRTRDGVKEVVWPNGSYAYLFGAHTMSDVDRLRARTNRCFDMREEIAAWRWLKEATTQADFGLRLGVHRWVGATTPRPRHTIKDLEAKSHVRLGRIRLSTASTEENIHLPEEKKAELYEMFGGTRVGAQELEGKIVDQVEGALWNQELIDAYRVTPEEVPRLIKVRTYVDPSWGTTNDECGIVVVALGVNKHVYVLDDLSKRTTPGEWGLIAALGYLPRKRPDGEFDALNAPAREWFGRVSERVIYESNFQGEQVKVVMKLTAKEIGRRILTKPVVASKGKRLRAEPVLWQYEKGRVHHVNAPGKTFAVLENQMTTWIPPEAGKDRGDPGDPPPAVLNEHGQESEWSPDRLDALVFGVTDLGMGPSGMRWNNRTQQRPEPAAAPLEDDEPDRPAKRPPPRRPAVGRIPQRAR